MGGWGGHWCFRGEHDLNTYVQLQTVKVKFRMEYAVLTLSQKPKEGEEGEGREGLGHLTPLYKFICIRVPLASVL